MMDGGIDALNSFINGDGAFSRRSVTRVDRRPFAGKMKTFVPSRFGISTNVKVRGIKLRVSATVFFRSIPSRCISIGLSG